MLNELPVIVPPLVSILPADRIATLPAAKTDTASAAEVPVVPSTCEASGGARSYRG